ncbi:MAG: helix-turn-helix domain-containing protein [bacterium]
MNLCLASRTDPAAASRFVRRDALQFSHVKCAPSPALAPFVEHYWATRWDRRGVPSRAAAALLDPCVHLQIIGGRAQVMGVVRGTYAMQIEGVGCVVGVKFRPGGFYPFVQQPLAHWTDRTVPAEHVFANADHANTTWARDAWDETAACLGDNSTHATLIAAHLDAFFLARLPARDAIAEDVADLVALIAGSAEVRRMRDLVRASGRSERTLHRLFDRYVGVSPAWVIRRYRLQAAAALLTARPPADVRAVAWELGYADQAHFIRDFRATIGVTPGAYVQSRSASGTLNERSAPVGDK